MSELFAFSQRKDFSDIETWDTSNVEDMEDMFINSPLEKNPPKWYYK